MDSLRKALDLCEYRPMIWKLDCGDYTLFVIEDGYYWRDPAGYHDETTGGSIPATTRARCASTSAASSSPTATEP
jgi:hypothetical protein